MNASTLSEVFSYRQKTYDIFDTAGAVEAVREDGFALIPVYSVRPKWPEPGKHSIACNPSDSMVAVGVN
jgi:hypothetical protein